MSSPRGFVVGGIGGMSAVAVAGVARLDVPFRRNGTTAVGDTPSSGIQDRKERNDLGALRMLRCIFRLRSDLFACGTYLERVSG